MNPKTFEDLYPGTSAIFDGGVATELYERGFYINRPFEELNLTHPRDVAGVHEAYLAAGAMMVTTNSFSLTTPQLEKFDNQGRQTELLQAAIQIASRAVKSVKPEAKVGLSLGPLGVLIEPLGRTAKTEVVDEYAKLSRIAQSTASLPGTQAGDFDFYILETFGNLDELECAIQGIRGEDKIRPILASITVVSTETTFIQNFAKRIGEREDVQALGMNCSEGPHDLLQSLKILQPLTRKKIVIQPNAGIPRNINGRYFYMTSPDYMAKFAKRFAESGAWGVGGCCGTGPDHIRAIAQAMKMVDVKKLDASRQPHLQIERLGVERTDVERRTLDTRKLSKIAEKLISGKKVISIELTSPRGTDVSKFLKALEKCRAVGIEFVNVPDGARASTRVSSLHLAAYVNTRTDLGITVIPHLTTRDRNLIALQADLLGASINHVHDVLLITGDPPKLGNTRDATAVYDIDSIGLTYLVDRMNQGLTPSGDDIGSQAHYGIGVASNPTAVNIELELKRWQYKVESGCDFAITQPIYEAETFLKWKKSIGSLYRPHIVGIWPFVSYKNAEFMAHEVPGVFVPKWALDEMLQVQDDPVASVQTGVRIASKIMNELWDHCEGFAISAPLGKIDVALETLKHLKGNF